MRTFAQKAKTACPVTHDRAWSSQNQTVRSVLRLQPTIGNQAALQLLQSNEEFKMRSAKNTSSHFLHNFNQITLLPNVRNGMKPELDAVSVLERAQFVVRKPDVENKQNADSVVSPRQAGQQQDLVFCHPASINMASAIRRQESGEEIEKLIAKTGFSGHPGRFPHANKINEALGGDFSQAEVYTGGAAKAANLALGSLGYTYLGKVALKDGDIGTQLHEAVHLVQLGYTPARAKVRGGSDRTTLEREASSTARVALKTKHPFCHSLRRIPENSESKNRVLKNPEQEFASWISEEERSRLEWLERWIQSEFVRSLVGGTLRGATQGTATGLSFGEISVSMPPTQQPQLGRGLTQQEVITLHDALFDIMVPESHFLAGRYNRETIRQATLGSAVYESIVRMPWERQSDELSAFGHYWTTEAVGIFGAESIPDFLRERFAREASVGPFQGYPMMTARALTNPSLRAWLEEHGDVAAQRFIERASGLSRESEFRAILRDYRGTQSLLNSASLSLAGKIALTLHAIRELDEANPVMRRLSRPQLLRIWMDYETVHCDHAYYASGEFHRRHLSLEAGEPLDLRSHSSEGFVQRHIMRRLGFEVWNQPNIPNPDPS